MKYDSADMACRLAARHPVFKVKMLEPHRRNVLERRHVAASHSRFCPKCGVQVDLGLAQCPQCGARVGTVFSEREAAKELPRQKERQHAADSIGLFQRLETARERANNALLLALGSFFCPGVGFFLGAASIMLGVNSLRTLKTHNVEEGRGPAWAGIIVGALGILAQFFYSIYLIKQGLPLFGA